MRKSQKFYLAAKDGYFLNYINLHTTNPMRLANCNIDRTSVRFHTIFYFYKEIKALSKIHPEAEILKFNNEQEATNYVDDYQLRKTFDKGSILPEDICSTGRQPVYRRTQRYNAQSN